MVESKKGNNLVNISRNSLKSKAGHLNINPKPYAKYENPSSSGSQDIVLTRFLWPSRKRGITLPYKVQPKKKKKSSLIFCTDATIKISSF